MSKGNTFENDLLKLIFQAVAIADIADNDATSPLTTLHVSLHFGDPGEGGDQTTSEMDYTGYARIPVARTAGGFAVAANVVTPVADIVFGAMSAGTNRTVTHFGIGTLLTGAGKLLYKGTVTPNIAVSIPIAPRLTTATTITED